MIRNKTIHIVARASRVCLALIVAIAYLLGSVSFEALHKLIAGHSQTIAHTQEQEQDPCHITLFHQERTGGCEHTTHIVEIDNCTLCDHSLPALLALLPEVLSTPTQYTNHTVTEVLSTSKEAVTLYTSGRAPPRS